MLTAILPHSHRGRVLALGALLDTVATGLYLAAATLYFVVYMHIPARSVGVALGVANVVGLLSPMPVARLTRRLGVARVYVALLLLRGLAMAAYALADGYWRYLLVTCFFTAVSRAALPLLQVLVGQLEGEENRTRTMASLRTVNNIGLALGFLIAAGIQLLHSRPAYMVLFLLGGLAFGAVALVTVAATRGAEEAVEGPAPGSAGQRGQGGGRARTVYTDGRFLTVAAANAVMLLHDSMLFILIPLWAVQRCGLSPTASSVLLMLNTALTVLLQVRLARFAKGTRGSLRLWGTSVLALAAASLLIGSTGQGTGWMVVSLLALAVALLTLGENLHAVAGWELSFLLSNPALRAQYLSLFSLGYTGQLIVGPVLMTSVVLPSGMPGLLLMVGLFALATVVTAVAVRARARDDDHDREGVRS
jgi:MFS family permease